MPKRIVFMGSDSIALPALNFLDESDAYSLVGVFTQPDRRSGRGQKVIANDIKQWAVERSIPVQQPVRLEEEDRQVLVNWQADIVLVMAYGHLLKEDWLRTPAWGTYNIHGSILPRYRGASPIQGCLLEGESESGVSLMQVVKKMDAGPVLAVEKVTIAENETAGSLEEKLSKACLPLMQSGFGLVFEDNPLLTAQDESKVTYTRKLRKEDGVLDFSESAEILVRRVNGLFPWPGTSLQIKGTVIRCGLAEESESPEIVSDEPGTLLGVDSKGLLVATGKGVLRLMKLQRPGGKMLPSLDFLRGFPLEKGLFIESVPMSKLVSSQLLKG
ncbi:MAG: methionyl-tRNA formyltransferase [Opitutaceae bacterium]|nr:methionyl-tRNA formyltransferase [Opitutaceae bacterium]